MLDRQAEAARRCHAYAEDAYQDAETGMGPGRTSGAGLINHLAGTHDHIRDEVTNYFGEVRDYATRQGEKVQESVDLYRSTDMEVTAMLDASVFLPERSQEAEALGRSADLATESEMAVGIEPEEPADVLEPLTDYRAEMPFEPEWIGTGRARDTIWQLTYFAHQLGLMPRPVDITAEVIAPFAGDWAGLKACADALRNLAEAARRLHTNVGWIELRIDAVWKGNVADACWIQVRKLQQSLQAVPAVMEGYAAAYDEVVTRIFELEQRAAEVLGEALDWGIAALFGGGGLALKAVGLFLPPFTTINGEKVVPLLEVVRLVYSLLDLVQLGVQAVWDFNARVELGMLHGPRVAASLPAVPAPAPGYT